MNSAFSTGKGKPSEVKKGNVTLFNIVKRATGVSGCETFLKTGRPADEYNGKSRLIAQTFTPRMDK